MCGCSSFIVYENMTSVVKARSDELKRNVGGRKEFFGESINEFSPVGDEGAQRHL